MCGICGTAKQARKLLLITESDGQDKNILGSIPNLELFRHRKTAHPDDIISGKKHRFFIPFC